MLDALARHHGDQQIGQVEGAHHPIHEVALAAGLDLDPRVPGDRLFGEAHEGLLVTVADGMDEVER